MSFNEDYSARLLTANGKLGLLTTTDKFSFLSVPLSIYLNLTASLKLIYYILVNKSKSSENIIKLTHLKNSSMMCDVFALDMDMAISHLHGKPAKIRNSINSALYVQ